MSEDDLKKVWSFDAKLKEKYADLLADRTEAYTFVDEQDFDYARLNTLAVQSGEYRGFGDYADRHSLDRPIFQIVSELQELAVLRHAQQLDFGSTGIQRP